MLQPILPNSPLSEVAAEVRFHGSLALLGEWGALQKNLRAEFPKLFVPGAVVGTSPLLQHVRLGSADDKTFVLLAVNAIAVATSDYSGFDSFKGLVQRVIKLFHEQCSAGPMTRFGLRYVNDLPPGYPADADSGDFHPALKLGVRSWPARSPKFVGQPQLVLDEERNGLQLRVSISTPEVRVPEILVGGDRQKLRFAFQPGTRFDLDASRTTELALSRLGAFLDAGHEAIEEIFLGAITPSYHGYLRG